MPDDPKKIPTDIQPVLESAATVFQGVKLGPGVVGRNTSIVWIFEFVMFAGVIAGIFERNTTVTVLSVAGAIVVAILGTVLNTYFAKQNPVAAVLEGAQFRKYYENQMGSRDKPVIDVSSPVPPPETETPETETPENPQ